MTTVLAAAEAEKRHAADVAAEGRAPANPLASIFAVLAKLPRQKDPEQDLADLGAKLVRLEKSYGPNSLQVAECRFELAGKHNELGVAGKGRTGKTADAKYKASRAHYEQAQALFLQALEVQEKHLGPNHPVVAATQNNLGMVYSRLKKSVPALQMYHASLQTKERIHGADHPVVPTTQCNIAKVYLDQNRLDESLEMYKIALATRERVHGADSVMVADTLYNIAFVYRTKQRATKSKQEGLDLMELQAECFDRIVPIYERAYGASNDETLDAKAKLNRARPEKNEEKIMIEEVIEETGRRRGRR